MKALFAFIIFVSFTFSGNLFALAQSKDIPGESKDGTVGTNCTDGCYSHLNVGDLNSCHGKAEGDIVNCAGKHLGGEARPGEEPVKDGTNQ